MDTRNQTSNNVLSYLKQGIFGEWEQGHIRVCVKQKELNVLSSAAF